MYIGKRHYSALVVGTREMLAKLDELDALYRDVSPDDYGWRNIGMDIENLRRSLVAELREFEMGLWEQNGYPTAERA